MKTMNLLSAFFVLSVIAPAYAAVVAENEKAGLISKSFRVTAQVSDKISARELSEDDQRILALAKSVAKKCARVFESVVKKGALAEEEIFSALYFPIMPITYPPTFSTFYDSYTDDVITPILDSYLARDRRIIAVGLVDRNGYLPSHNSKYSRPSTGNPEIDIMNNRTKRIFNDIAGIRAARNTGKFLLQTYRRDTGENTAELSVPVFVLNRHWGAVRILYNRGE